MWSTVRGSQFKVQTSSRRKTRMKMKTRQGRDQIIWVTAKKKKFEKKVTQSPSQSQPQFDLEQLFTVQAVVVFVAVAVAVDVGAAGVTHPSHVLPQQPPKLSTAKNWAVVSVGARVRGAWLYARLGWWAVELRRGRRRGCLQMSMKSSTKKFPVVKALPLHSQLLFFQLQHIFLWVLCCPFLKNEIQENS